MKLAKVISSNPSKTNSESLEVLIRRLYDIKTLLPTGYFKKTILKNKLLNSTRDMEYYCLASHKPANTLQGGFLDLHISLSTAKKHFKTRWVFRTCCGSPPFPQLSCKKPRHPGCNKNCFFSKRPSQQIIRPMSALSLIVILRYCDNSWHH